MQIPKKSRVKEKITYPWTLLKEPRFISAMWATVYSIFALNGIIFIAFTPGDLIDRNGIAISLLCGILLFVGGICGLISLHGGQWYVERAGIYFTIAGVLGYMVIVFIVSDTWSELVIRLGFSLITICVLMARFYKVRELILDPNK